MAEATTTSLQVTALLDELLGVGKRPEEAEAAPPEANRTPEPSSASSSRGGRGTPRNMQLTDLCNEIDQLNGEMDACLASIGRWEEQRRQRQHALEKELEVHSNSMCVESLGDEAYAAEDAVPFQTEDPSRLRREELERELEACYGIGRGSPPVDLAGLAEEASTTGGASPRPWRGLASTPASPIASAEAALAAAARAAAEDEARIGRLRAEVELLRRQQQHHPWDSHEGARQEAPSPFGFLPFEDSLGSPRLDADGEVAGVCSLEGRLKGARDYLGSMEDAIGEANFSVDAEIRELERLLGDCDTALAKMRPSLA